MSGSEELVNATGPAPAALPNPFWDKAKGLLAGGGSVESDSPLPDIRLGLGAVALFFVLFLGWASIVRVDSAVYAHGSIAVVGSRQEVQHKEGGIVAALFVKEGDEVAKGQELIRLNGDETEANADALMGQFIDLKSREAMLLAEQREQTTLAEPVEFADLPAQFRPLIDTAMLLQRKTLAANRNFLDTQLSVLAQRSQQTKEQITGDQQQMAANLKRQDLTKDELSGVQDLQVKGYAPMTRVRSLQEEVAGLEGDYGALQANVATAQAQIGEIEMQSLSAKKQFMDQVLSDLNDVQAKLKTMEPQLQAARAAYDRLHIRATATGKVMGLTVFTVGGVIAPGQKIMDIVPAATPLVINASVESKNGNDIHPGMEAQVRFTSLHERNVPILKGKVLDVSGDTFTDKDNNRSFYTARIEITPETVKTLDSLADGEALKPGLPVEVIVPEHKRTVMQYLLEPLNQSLWKSFRED
ncbi:MAG TPA: HlyD family type I secretion periplasmic adaptor subunit [Asticcacaulis sp.]|nr:HlyD family type I secretion periplasmic adaptor subunit [Asticcacaulis sp.]